ncbi:hypothetical protein [Methanonatronarchaeum sp. AMET6-2]|uniref:hypothetical protein n=1 Tax=Methanonatronarchaeum sp. AMET6-2 TaxID=2933293 RepID=UPI001FF1EF15|nr:hypothetical protein [Methanonatronarchaeum sp. AMET6-2]UOY10608.1 hypothetical protein MU439_02925 [Methanonatronarchaeum sp. AMET6-2]
MQAWLDEDEVLEALARCDEDDPYVDEFGQDITGYNSDEEEFDDDLLVREESRDSSVSESNSESEIE